MGINVFKEHLGAFPEVLNCVKPLCKEIGVILFPLLEDGVLHTGSPSDTPECYIIPSLKRLTLLLSTWPLCRTQGRQRSYTECSEVQAHIRSSCEVTLLTFKQASTMTGSRAAKY